MLEVYLRYPLGDEREINGCVAVAEVWPPGAGEGSDGTFDYDLWEKNKVVYAIYTRVGFAKFWRMLRLLGRPAGGVKVFSCFSPDVPVSLP